MARLIDADKLLTNVIAINNSKGQVTWSEVSTADFLAAPTVDAVEVVRCKDCKYSYEGIGNLICSHGVCVDCIVPPKFYCAEGK